MARPGFLKSNRLEQEALTFAIVGAMIVLLSVLSPSFLNPNNLSSLQTSIAPNLIVAVGMMALFMIGRFDLSVGATMGIAGITSAMALEAGAPTGLAVLAGLFTGTVIGAFNGVFVACLGINHLIVTLGVLYMTRGIIEVIMSGQKLAGFTAFTDGFNAIGQTTIAGVFVIFIAAIMLCLFMEALLRQTVLGRKLLFLGGNPKAAVAIGINKRKIDFWCFVLSGFLAALAGVFMTSRVGMANRYMGDGLEMQIFIACLIGGGSIAGGKGSFAGAFAGVLFITLLTNAFNLLSVPSEWQSVVIGTVLIIVVLIDGILLLRKQHKPWHEIIGLPSIRWRMGN